MSEVFGTQHIYINPVSKGRFSEAQAEAFTDALRNVVTKDVNNLASIGDIARLENEFRSDMKIIRQQLTILFGGIMVVGIGILAALMQFTGKRRL